MANLDPIQVARAIGLLEGMKSILESPGGFSRAGAIKVITEVLKILIKPEWTVAEQEK